VAQFLAWTDAARAPILVDMRTMRESPRTQRNIDEGWAKAAHAPLLLKGAFCIFSLFIFDFLCVLRMRIGTTKITKITKVKRIIFGRFLVLC
jgi:hypothetical protein